MSNESKRTPGETRDGEPIEGIYQGQGFCLVDAGGKRFGVADWYHGGRKQMDGDADPMLRVRPIDQAAAQAIQKAIAPQCLALANATR